jgi:putative membrane protein insertion efficiency factor
MTRRAVPSSGRRPNAIARCSTFGPYSQSLVRRMSVVPIGLYRIVVSPILFSHYGPACRFEPQCSSYAREAILRHGLPRGLMLTLRRVIRCRPGGGFGFDPVPCERIARA